MKKALIIVACFLLPAAAVRAQDILPVNDLPFELPVPDFHSTLLFNGWVKAAVLWYNPVLRTDTSLWFDFDKATQRLLVTTDKKTEFLFDKREFQSVTFHLGISAFTFLHVPVINDYDLFYELVRSDHRYSLYKSIRPKVWRDGYLDWNEYYIIFPFPQVRVLKLSAPDKWLLDRAFELSGDKQIVDRYYALHSDEEQGEHFLKGLIEYLNR
ncbi:MAG TPA: hypothetical protein VG101_03895 [Puia sp.]|nr:hypothetical protein [Puia sp.]